MGPSIRNRRGEAPGRYLVRPEPALPEFRSTAELHNRLLYDNGQRPGHCLVAAVVGLVVLMVTSIVVQL